MALTRIIKFVFAPRPWMVWVLMAVLVGGVGVLLGTGRLQPLVAFLDSDAMALTAGGVRISLFLVLKTLFTVLLLFWLGSLALNALERQLERMRDWSSSSRALVFKIAQFFTYFLLLVVSLNVVGVDLSALAVIGGAIGIGIGFGLQKITSNYISGIILLMEKAIEQEDLIELNDGTFGFVRHNGARYTLIETPNGKEILVPNEDFITGKVVNWTYSNKHARIDVPVGVSYASDIRRAQALMLEAAREHPRCVADPAPECHLREFADSSVNFLLVFWVEDITEGRMRVQSEVMFAIWDKFAEHGIQIPFPQRDVYIKSLPAGFRF